MAFLTIAGTDYDVETTNAGREAPDTLGSVKRAFDGTLLNARRGSKRKWHYTLPLTKTAADALELALGTGLVTCGGADLPATQVYQVDITGWTDLEDTASPDGFQVEVTVSLMEP